MGHNWSMCQILSLRYILNESSTDGAECCRKIMRMMKVVDPIRSLVNASSLQFDCAKMLYEAIFMLFYCMEARQW